MVNNLVVEHCIGEAKKSVGFYSREDLIYISPYSRSSVDCGQANVMKCTKEEHEKRYPYWINGLSKETYNDYIASNERSHFLVYNAFSTSDSQVIFDRDRNEANKNYLRHRSKILKVIYISDIGFNKDRTQALLEYSISNSDSDYGRGAGLYLLLEKEKGSWQIKTVGGSWLAH